MADVGLAMQRATDKTEQMKARANAVQELEASGTFDDLTALGSGEDDIDRQLKELSSSSEVDDEMAKLKAELGSGATPTAELGAGSAGSAEPVVDAEHVDDAEPTADAEHVEDAEPVDEAEPAQAAVPVEHTEPPSSELSSS